MGSRNRCRDGDRSNLIVNYNNDYLAERCGRAPSPCRITSTAGYYVPVGVQTRPPINRRCVMQAGLSMVVWILKREVRATFDPQISEWGNPSSLFNLAAEQSASGLNRKDITGLNT